MTDQTKKQLIKALQNIGTDACLKKADELESHLAPISSLHLRDLNLSESNIKSLAYCLKDEKGALTSISFSYNSALGDAGAITLSKSLPSDISEIGLVKCGIADRGGIEILHWMKSATQLRMICIEQNNFSEELKFEYRQFNANHPKVLVVV